MMTKSKIISLLSLPLLTLLISTSIANKESNYNNLYVQDKEVIVLFEDNKTIEDFKKELGDLNSFVTIKKEYKGIVNGVLIDCNYEVADVLPSFQSVLHSVENKIITVQEESFYYLNKSSETPLENNSKKMMNLPETSNEGEGTLIAVLDSSFTCDHNAFADLEVGTEVKLTQDDIDSIVESGDLSASTADLGSYYYNSKIPYKHDYGGNITYLDGETGDYIHREDDDVTSLLSSHGMHVSSIATANGEFKGIAPKAQLAFMKVFADYSTGSTQYAFDDFILSALNDCYVIGADVVNMSLGSSLNEFENSAALVALNRLKEAGITVSASAGNDGKATWELSGAYSMDSTAITQSGAVGSYSSYDSVTSVASGNITDDDFIEADVSVNGKTLKGREQTTRRQDDETYEYKESDLNLQFTSLIPEGEDYVALEYVMVPGLGSLNDIDDTTGENLGNDYASIDVEGKIAVIERGIISFGDKIGNAKEMGAIGCIITNNEGNSAVGYFDFSETPKSNLIPTLSMGFDDHEFLEEQENKVIVISRKMMSTFSTDGTTDDLKLRTDVTTPGQNIAGAVNVQTPSGRLTKTSYEYMSGTSMAAPNYSGVVSMILGEQEFATPEEELAYKETLKMRVMSTSDPVMQANGAYYSPKKQGAGYVNVTNALSTSLYLEGNVENETKIELKNSESIRNGVVDLTFTIHNEEALTGEYDGTLYVQRAETTTLDSQDYAEFKDVVLQTTNDTIIGTQDFTVQLTGEAQQEVTVSYEISEEEKGFIDETFPYGTIVEGYCILEGSSLPTLSIPYLGYYGDYSNAPCVEPFNFEQEEGILYQSELLNNLCDVTGIQKPNANFTSLIGVTSGGMNITGISDIAQNNSDPYDLYNPIGYEVVDGETYLYAGSSGQTDTLYIQQFVNRSVVDNDVYLIDSSGNIVLFDHMFDMLFGGDGEYALYKSVATASLFNQGYVAHRAYTILPLKDRRNNAYYEDGIYTLRFIYQLVDGTTQTKEYKLVIDSEADLPAISSLSFNDEIAEILFNERLLRLTYNGNEVTSSNGAYSLNVGNSDKVCVEVTSLKGISINILFYRDSPYILYGETLSDQMNLEVTYSKETYEGQGELSVYDIRIYTNSGANASLNGRNTYYLGIKCDDETTELYSANVNNNGELVESEVTRFGDYIIVEFSRSRIVSNFVPAQVGEVVPETGDTGSSNVVLIATIVSVLGGVLIIGGAVVGVFYFKNKKVNKQ